MLIDQLKRDARTFSDTFEQTKKNIGSTEFPWYPYGSLTNFVHLDKLLSGQNRDFSALVGNAPIVDIGCADGDVAFFLESQGFDVHVVDNGPTNYNTCLAVRKLKVAFDSKIQIHEVDLDAQFQLPAERYGLAIFLGILYHLKNPYYALEQLAHRANYCLLSTRVTQFSAKAQGDVRIAEIPAAYLVAADECNNDATNFWMFTQAGLKRIVDRTGWQILDFITVGNTKHSDPATSAGDERAFCLLKSKYSEV
jgi:tRNA (mo5U34)-methyltransferase